MSSPRDHADGAVGPRIDLHSHSSWSDGTQSVPELFDSAREAGLDVLALTDHDTVRGWEELPAAVAASGVAAVPGIEVSAEHERRSVHVLALLVDPSEDTELAAELARARDSRRDRARAMAERLSEDFPINWEDVRAQAADPEATLGRPHLADALVAAGVVSERAEAFARMLHPDAPYYVRHYAPSPGRAVEVIRRAGGVAIAAHPGSVTRTGPLPREVLEEMIDAGLSAIEVEHREHDPGTRSALRDLARSKGLLTTGGSDYHGAGKPNRLGENLTAPSVLDALLNSATSPLEVIRP